MKKYQIREKINGNLLDNLLHNRNIRTTEEREKFLNLNYEKHIHHPFLLKDAEKAAKRIIEAIENNQRIVIYSDYDADGIPAGVIYHDFFKKIGYTNFSNYIPHRHDEGFGLNTDAVNKFIEEKVDLIITLDCGISDIEAVNLATDNKLDVIITDHHEPHDELPRAYAIVDHKQKNCNYPEKILCGSGVGYKLIQAILEINRFGLKEGHEKWFLDMIGLATLSDMVPLVGENRIFASYGLMVMRKSPRKGLVRLLKHLKIRQNTITEDDIGFMITPRINAASRMGIPMDAFKLLSTDSEDEAYLYVEHLDKINTERKTVVAKMVKEVKKIIKDRYNNEPRKVIVMGNPDWKPSLLGLVANTLAEEFSRPAFLWGRDGDGIIKGSCRSGGYSSVVEIMNNTSKATFIQYGGHSASGGFVVSDEKIHFLDDELNKAFEYLQKDLKDGKSLIDPDYIDMQIRLDEVNWGTYRDVEKLAPFGMGNHKPLFIFKDVKISGIKEFGKEKNHLELIFKKINEDDFEQVQKEVWKKDVSTIKAIGFFMRAEKFKVKDKETKEERQIKEGDSIDLIATMEKSTFGGRVELRLRIEDII